MQSDIYLTLSLCKEIGGNDMKKFKKIMAIGLSAIMALSILSTFAFASENAEEDTIYFVQTDKDGNYIKTVPLVKTEPGMRQAEMLMKERATKPIWDLSQNNYSLTKKGFAGYTLPYRFTGNSGYRVGVTANMTVPDGEWAEIAINNVTSGTVYMGSIEMDQNGSFFSISGILHGIISNNYYTYTMQASSGCSYSDIELYQR